MEVARAEPGSPVGSPKTLKEALIHCGKGCLIGFLVFAIPSSMRRRKLTGLRSGSALSVLLGSFRAVHVILDWTGRQQGPLRGSLPPWLQSMCKKYTRAVAASIAILLSLLVDKSINQSTFVLWLLVRAARCLVPSIPYAPVVVMCLSAAPILSTWATMPVDLSPSYKKFLDHQGGKSKEAMSHLLSGRPVVPLTCTFVHPGMSCSRHAVVFFLEGLRRALPVYLPLTIIGMALSKRPSLKTAVLSLVRSCSFLSLYCTLEWACACIYFRLRPGVTRAGMFTCTWPGGLAVLLETKGRQVELAAYCFTHALDIAYRAAKRTGWATPNDLIAYVALSVSAGIIMHNYDQQPAFITKHLFGIESKEHATSSTSESRK